MEQILIVDNDYQHKKKLKRNAIQINPKLNILSADSYRKAYKMALKNRIGAFFLNTQLLDGSGIDLAKDLRQLKEYKFTPIIFITPTSSRRNEAFHNIHCYDYIVRPYPRQLLYNIMKDILIDYLGSMSDKLKTSVILDYKGTKQKVMLENICYIEYRDRRIIIVTISEEIVYKNLAIKKFKEELDERFVQIHQSFVVNTSYIERIEFNNKFIKIKGASDLIPIGISYKKNLENFI